MPTSKLVSEVRTTNTHQHHDHAERSERAFPDAHEEKADRYQPQRQVATPRSSTIHSAACRIRCSICGQRDGCSTAVSQRYRNRRGGTGYLRYSRLDSID